MKGICHNSDRKWIFYAGVLIALLPVVILRDYTPDNELRYLSITDEALRNHDFFAFHNHGEAYADKPPLYFWLLMACRLIAGSHCVWLLSLCSLIPAFGVVAIMDKWTANALRSEGREREEAEACEGGLGRVMLMTSAYFLGAAVILRMDMLMCFFIVLSLHTFWKMYQGNGSKSDRWLFPIWLFMGLFTKGPLGILIPVMSILAFLVLKGDIKTAGRYLGWRTWGVLLALCAAWFAGVYLDGGKEYLDNLLFHQTIDRAVDSFHHKRPFFYYLTAVWYIIAPWSLYVAGAVAASLRKPSEIPAVGQFYITIAITTLVILSCISSKLQIYFLPAVPFMVYSAAIPMPKYQKSILTKIALAMPYAVLTLAFPVAVAAGKFGIRLETLVYIAAGILTAGSLTGIIILFRNKVMESVYAVACSLLAFIFTAGWCLPHYNEYLGYGALCKEAKETAAREGVDKIYVWKIKRPENMDVYFGKDVEIIPQDSMPASYIKTDGLLLTPRKEIEATGRAADSEAGLYGIVIFKKNP